MKFNYYKSFIVLLVLSISLSSFGIHSPKDKSSNLCPEPTFSNASIWRSSGGYRIAPGEGMNGNTALLVQRSNPKSYKLLTKKINGLKANTAYNFGVWVKGKNIRVTMKGMDRRGGTVCIEFYYKGKYMSGGSYPRAPAFDSPTLKRSLFVTF